MQAERTCRYCGQRLVRRRGEVPSHWIRREHCGNLCRAAATERDWVDTDGPPWREVDGCWVWDRTLMQGSGYGKVSTREGTQPAHRWVYEHAIGPVPDELELDHLCRNRACVNPAHLEPVTSAENVRRSPRVKLSPEHVAELRALHEGGRFTHQSLAEQFGVSRSNVSMILSGRIWRA